MRRVVVGQILKFGVGRRIRLRVHGPISIGTVENRMKLVCSSVIMSGLRRSNPRASSSSCPGKPLSLREVKDAIRESLECNRTSAPEEAAIDLRLPPLLQLLEF